MRKSPKSIRKNILGQTLSVDLIVADVSWGPFRPIDAVVGDYILLPHQAVVEGNVAVEVDVVPTGNLYRAISPGVGRAELESGWSAFVRIERACYRGMGKFRNLEECDDE
jgi:hypothetical protein